MKREIYRLFRERVRLNITNYTAIIERFRDLIRILQYIIQDCLIQNDFHLLSTRI